MIITSKGFPMLFGRHVTACMVVDMDLWAIPLSLKGLHSCDVVLPVICPKLRPTTEGPSLSWYSGFGKED